MTNRRQGCSEEKKMGGGGRKRNFFKLNGTFTTFLKVRVCVYKFSTSGGTPYPVNATSLTRGVALPLPSV